MSALRQRIIKNLEGDGIPTITDKKPMGFSS